MRNKRILIPVILLSVLAAASLVYTVYMGLCADPAAGPAGARFSGFGAYLSLFSGDRLTAVIQSLVLRLVTVACGGLIGWGAAAGASRIRSPYGRAVLAAIFLLPAFIPADVWGAMLRNTPENARRVLSGSIPLFSLTASAGLLFSIRDRSRLGVLAVLLLSLGAVFSTDAPLDLSVRSANITLHSLIASGVTADAFAAAGFKMAVECVLSLALILTLMHAFPDPEDLDGFRPSRDAGCGGACAVSFGTVFLISCLALVPLLFNIFNGTISVSSVPSDSLWGSLLPALIALAVTFACVLCVLSLSGNSGRVSRSLLILALPLLLSVTPLKSWLVSRFALPSVVPAVLSACLNPVTAMLTALFVLLDTRNFRVHLLAAGAAAAAAAAFAAGSAWSAIMYAQPSLGGLLESRPDHSVFAVLLPILLVLGCAGTSLFAGIFSFTDRARAAAHQSVVPKQGLTRMDGELQEPQEAEKSFRFRKNEPRDTRPSVYVPTLENKSPEKLTSDESISAHSVPAASAYTEQFLKTSEGERSEPPVLSRTLPLNDPVPAQTSTPSYWNGAAPDAGAQDPVGLWSAPAVSQAPAAPQAPDPEPEFDPTAPSPAQIVSLINALTRMRSLGIVSDREYREKRETLMRML